VAFGNIDRLLFVGLHRFLPESAGRAENPQAGNATALASPGFRAYRKSRSCRGRAKMPVDIRQLIREMRVADPLWGAPRIHGEMLKLGIDVGETTEAKYMAKRRRPPLYCVRYPRQRLELVDGAKLQQWLIEFANADTKPHGGASSRGRDGGDGRRKIHSRPLLL